jgi:hypothetical protein
MRRAVSAVLLASALAVGGCALLGGFDFRDYSALSDGGQGDDVASGLDAAGVDRAGQANANDAAAADTPGVPTPAIDAADTASDRVVVNTPPVPISVTTDVLDVAEGYGNQLAVAPDGTIAVAWVANVTQPPYGLLRYRFSTDQGATFSPITAVPLPSNLLALWPSIASDSAGNFYIAVLGAHLVTQSDASAASIDYTRLFVSKAPKGSMTFGAPVEATDPTQIFFNDIPKILVTQKGTIVVGFAQFPVTPVAPDAAVPTTNAGLLARSTDGQTWQRTTVVGPPAVANSNWFWLCEGTGILYATYLDLGQTTSAALRSSLDDGVTWSTTSAMISGTDPLAYLAPGCVADGNDVWVLYSTTTSPAADPSNYSDAAQAIRVAHSADRGGTWSTARMDALDKKAGSLALLPILVRETGGALDVAYLSGNMEADVNGTVRYVRALSPSDAGTDDSGATFGPSVQVDGPLTFTARLNGNDSLGEYMGAAAFGGKLLVSYPTNRSGFTRIFFRSMPLY